MTSTLVPIRATSAESETIMGLSSDIWARRDSSAANEISSNLYAFTISALTIVGILVSLAFSRISYNWVFTSRWQLWGLIIGVLVAGFAGVLISTSSDSAGVSFVGYMLIAGPFGLMVGPVLAQYTDASVARIFVMTTIIVALFGVVGAVIPENLSGWGSYVLMALFVLILGYLFVPLAGFVGVNGATALSWLDWIGIVIFCGIVVFDWNRAMHLPKTLDNAVDSAVAIYLDWFNIFIRLLSQEGTKKS